LVAWHIDFLKERQQTIPLDIDSGIKEMGKVRYTSHFKIFQYSKVPDFRKMIFYAIKYDIYDHTIFKTRVEHINYDLNETELEISFSFLNESDLFLIL
jgi:hypothetical protein